MSIEEIAGLVRVEDIDNDDMHDLCIELTHSVYKHDEVYGDLFTLEKYIEVDTKTVFYYLCDKNNIKEWSYNIRKDSLLNCTIDANVDTYVIDYLWTANNNKTCVLDMLRAIPAQPSLDKRGTVLLWSIARNEIDNLNDSIIQTRYLSALRKLEMNNIKKILEYRNNCKRVGNE